MALSIKENQSFRPYRTLGLSRMPSMTLLEAASQVFTKGAPLIYTSSYVTIAGSDPASVIGVSLEAGHNAATDGLKSVKMVPAINAVTFSGVLTTGSGGLTLAQTHVGISYEIAQDGTNKGWYVDQSATTALSVYVLRLIDPAGTVDGRVEFIWHSTRSANTLARSTVY